MGGFTLGGGVYVSWGTPSGFDFGVYGSAGGGIGFDMGAGAGVTYVPGPSSNISGTTVDINGSAGILSGSLSGDVNHLSGSGSLDLSAGLPGAALTTTHTVHFGYQDFMKLIHHYFGPKRSRKDLCSKQQR